MKSIVHIIACACAFFSCTTQNAGTVDDVGSGIISGQLLDRDGTAITHKVVVSLYTSDSLQTGAKLLKAKTSGTKPYATVDTDNGWYTFDSLDAGEYRIVVSEDGIIVGKKSDITLSSRQSLEDTLRIDDVISIQFIITGEQSEEIRVENTLIENCRVINIDSGYIIKTVTAEEFSFKMVIQQNYDIDTIEVTVTGENNQSVTFTLVDTSVSITLISQQEVDTKNTQQQMMDRWNETVDNTPIDFPAGTIGLTVNSFYWRTFDRFPHPTFSGGSEIAYQTFAVIMLAYLENDDNFNHLAEHHLFDVQLGYSGTVWGSFRDLVTQFSSEATCDYIHDEKTCIGLKQIELKIAEVS